MATTNCNTLNVTKRDISGYLPIENYGMIGNMRTCALVSMDGSVGKDLITLLGRQYMMLNTFFLVDFMCW